MTDDERRADAVRALQEFGVDSAAMYRAGQQVAEGWVRFSEEVSSMLLSSGEHEPGATFAAAVNEGIKRQAQTIESLPSVMDVEE